jgi:acetolactate synthase-1/2/3 large subunit
LRAIRDVLPDNGVFVDELTQVGYTARSAYEARLPRTYISSGYQGTLGWGVAVGLGARHALDDVPVVAISGDGGFMFNVQELATAVRHRIPLVVVLFNDGAYGNVRNMQKSLHGNRVIGSDLANPDFVRLAEAFGIAGHRVGDAEGLRRALEKSLASGAPALIEVPVGDMPSPWPFIDMPKVRGG